MNPADYAIAGAQSLGGDIKVKQDREYARAEEDRARNRPLSSFEKRLSQALSGELDASQAGLLARLEHEGHVPPGYTPPPPQQALATPAPASQTPPASLAATGPAYGSGSFGYSPQPAAPTAPPVQAPQRQLIPPGLGQTDAAGEAAYPTPPPQRAPVAQAETAGDYQALLAAAPFVKAPNSMSPADRWAIEKMKDDTKRSEGGANRESREGMSGDRLTEKKAQREQQGQQYMQNLAQRWQEAVLRARTTLSAVQSRGGTARDIALINSQVRQQSAELSALSHTLSGLAYMGNPDAQEAAEKMKAEVERLQIDLAAQIKTARTVPNHATSRSSVGGSVPGPGVKPSPTADDFLNSLK